METGGRLESQHLRLGFGDKDGEYLYREGLSLFGRVPIFIWDSQSIRDALQSSKGHLTRSSLYTEESLDAFWKRDVAPLFHDKLFQPFEDFSHVIPGIQIYKHPIAPKKEDQIRKLIDDIQSVFQVT